MNALGGRGGAKPWPCARRPACGQGKGGALAVVGADAEILKSSFHRCTSAAWGGAVWAAELVRYPFTGLQASVVVSESDFTNNSAVFGGAMAVSAKATSSASQDDMVMQC